ncbi:MAG: shikimate kinase [Alphaproteobacteria bacterium]|nr:shikimate kinase [Alphaproteobacteria bacterium]
MNELTTANQDGPAHWRTRPLVLVGLMGAGKSTIGRRLAKQIGWRFVDSDEEIEAAAGCCVADIFTIHGEAIFRDLEQRVINRLLGEEPMVLATGGGAWMQPAVRAMIKQRATSVWLRAELNVLTDRVSKRTHRPLLETGDKRSILDRLMQERYPVYALADMVIDSSDGPHERVVERVVAALEHQEVGL